MMLVLYFMDDREHDSRVYRCILFVWWCLFDYFCYFILIKIMHVWYVVGCIMIWWWNWTAAKRHVWFLICFDTCIFLFICDAGCGCVGMLMNSKDHGDGMRNHDPTMTSILMWQMWAKVDCAKWNPLFIFVFWIFFYFLYYWYTNILAM